LEEESMTAETIEIRRLRPHEAGRFREIRLEALSSNPESFGASYEVEDGKPLEWFAERLANFNVFGAYRGTDLLGIAGFAVHTGPKMSHKGFLWTRFVRPHARRRGVGRRLVEAIVETARRSVEILQLTVVSDNVPALRLYLALGFVQYGVERHGLKVDGRYYDEVLMAKDLA
jgi:ribosomal protein S18 acetylase RimI-like enzyme